MVIRFETEEGEKEIEVKPLEGRKERKEEEEEIKKEEDKEEIGLGIRGAIAPPISESGGFCSYEEKDWKVELDEAYNPVSVSVEGIDLNVTYKVWW